ncbi:MAG: DNA polymerase III subunit gamma/tau [Sphingobacteriales bacterium]|nr:DNA polymerase III subunit gamma/tau [Sphingobacteriales bacterium]
MDKFIVSARKYRPQTFDTVVGQSHITTTLKNAIKNQQLAHAFLFCGPRGVGKTTCARILAKTINCENPGNDGEACNECSSCNSFNVGASMNYFELDAASNNSVDNIRDLVDQIRFVPQTGKYKVYVIDEVHMLSSSAFNAFLKTLEEPPSYAIFILATTEKHRILPTILSRCQIFDFKRITINDTVHHLQDICKKEEVRADKASLQVIAQKSEGCMRDALSILDKIVSFTNGELTYTNTLEHLNILDAEFYFKLLNCMQQQDLAGAMLLYDEINRKGFEGDLVMNGFAEFIRNLLVSKDEKAAVLMEVVESYKDKYVNAAKNVPAPVLISALNILNEAEINYKPARNKRLHVELALIKLCYLQQAIELTAGSPGLSKKKIADSALAFRTTAIKSFTGKTINKTTGTKLLIETDNPVSIAEEDKPSIQSSETDNRQTHANKPASGKAGKLSALDKIRKQYQNNGNNGNGSATQILTEESLQACWANYIKKLKAEKNPAAHSFEMAELRIKDNNSFEAVIADTIEKQFIEQDRNRLFAFLQEQMNIRSLQFTVIIEEKNGTRQQQEISLTAKEQLIKMTKQYPMIKELKDRLRLELDY